MNILLSIKPKYVEEMIKGNKKYEFRRTIFKERSVDEIWIYASSPIKKIIGILITGEIIRDTPMNLWKNLKKHSGMHEQEFFNYFCGKDVGFAIKIEGVESFKIVIDPKTIFSNFVPPQSFYYFDDTSIRDMELIQGIRCE